MASRGLAECLVMRAFAPIAVQAITRNSTSFSLAFRAMIAPANAASGNPCKRALCTLSLARELQPTGTVQSNRRQSSDPISSLSTLRDTLRRTFQQHTLSGLTIVADSLYCQ